jgi:superoxide dismutase, Fe-Mn family
MKKRDFLKSSIAVAAGALIAPSISASSSNLAAPKTPRFDKLTDDNGVFVLPRLPYSPNFLEPVIDNDTVVTHHSMHHAAYVKGLNMAVEGIKRALETNDYSLIKHWEREMAFNGAGHYLHTLYWNSMGKREMPIPENLKKLIDSSFGSFDKFKALFTAATKSVEASGWGVLAYQHSTGKLIVLQAEKHQDLTTWDCTPILVCDVWEHAYYLKYQNRRPEYISAFWNVVNWDEVSKRFDSAR